MDQQVERREEGVGQSIEVFVPDGGQILKPDAAILRMGRALSAIDGDLVPTGRETVGEFFGEGLKPTVVGGDAARS